MNREADGNDGDDEIAGSHGRQNGVNAYASVGTEVAFSWPRWLPKLSAAVSSSSCRWDHHNDDGRRKKQRRPGTRERGSEGARERGKKAGFDKVQYYGVCM